MQNEKQVIAPRRTCSWPFKYGEIPTLSDILTYAAVDPLTLNLPRPYLAQLTSEYAM